MRSRTPGVQLVRLGRQHQVQLAILVKVRYPSFFMKRPILQVISREDGMEHATGERSPRLFFFSYSLLRFFCLCYCTTLYSSKRLRVENQCTHITR